ncbi:FliH/SctL family protein [Desulfovibrio sp.]|uniref:FliH/SctL family protein n=1 Tax=Desulfovibrio sp. TaxID=885 RepID=UPI0025BF1BBB|nr:FliH/SctL family protein [Desulfovibrio sp.]
MASDQLRKKWGTVFMGEREATVEQLDAMQEPLRRERAQQQEQEDYFARVRAKAEERAREILGAAYAERQRVLDEARAEAQDLKQRLIGDSETLKAQAQEEKNQAGAELGKAQALREQAQAVRDAAHGEGFQAGMDQAGQELKEFRAEMGQALGSVLYALDAQRRNICDAWREELALLTQEAVTAGTGWVLEEEHKRILQALVFEALNLLEDRASITVRVHPDDEGTVGDMFMAARERVPELQQWVVNGDESVERGGLVAESASGSVDCRREHYAELVNGILSHLTLGPDQKEESDGEAVSRMVQQEAERIAAMAPAPGYPSATSDQAGMPPHAAQAAPAEAGPEISYEGAHEASSPEADDPLDVGLPVDSSADIPGSMAADHSNVEPEYFHAAEEPAPDAALEEAVPHGQDNQATMVEDGGAQVAPAAAAPEDADRLNAGSGAASANATVPDTEPALPAASATEQGGFVHAPGAGEAAAGGLENPHMAAPMPTPMPASGPEDAPPASGQSDADVRDATQVSAADAFAEKTPANEAPGTTSTAPPGMPTGQDSPDKTSGMGDHGAPSAGVAPQTADPAVVTPAVVTPAVVTPAVVTPAAQPGAHPANPTLAELEDELFPLDDEPAGEFSGQSGHAGPAGQSDSADHDVFSQGGFLSGAGKGR